MTPQQDIQSQIQSWTPQQYLDWGKAQGCFPAGVNPQIPAKDQAPPPAPAPVPVAAPAPEPGLLPDGHPDCRYYQAQVDSMPKPVQLGFLVMPKILDPQNVLLTCGLANSVVGGVDLATGNPGGFVNGGQQAEIGLCDAGRDVLPLDLPPC
jgi:hypothetical protein